MQVQRTQSTSYEERENANGNQCLDLRVHHGYQRSLVKRLYMLTSIEQFIEAHGKNIGAHPFIAGLSQVLEWNHGSSTVVAWNCTLFAIIDVFTN